MHRRQLLARVMTTGLVLVGGVRLASSQSERGVRAIQDSYERLEALNAEKDATIGVATGRISAVEIQILLQAYDEASAKFRSGPPYFVGDLGQAFAGRFEMTQRPRVGQKRVISVPSGVTGIDYEQLAKAISLAMTDGQLAEFA